MMTMSDHQPRRTAPKPITFRRTESTVRSPLTPARPTRRSRPDNRPSPWHRDSPVTATRQQAAPRGRGQPRRTTHRPPSRCSSPRQAPRPGRGKAAPATPFDQPRGLRREVHVAGDADGGHACSCIVGFGSQPRTVSRTERTSGTSWKRRKLARTIRMRSVVRSLARSAVRESRRSVVAAASSGSFASA